MSAAALISLFTGDIGTVNTQPAWVCDPCGQLYGFRKQPNHATWHNGQCGVCHKPGPVTEPRDFGYLHPDWREGDE